MQRYENKPNEQGVAKRILLEFLDYLRYKIENDKLTMGEVEGLSRMLQENLPLSGTIADFAEYYKKPEVNVRVAINSAVANYPDKGWYASTDKAAIAREVESMANMSRQILTQVPMHQKIVQGCEALILQLNPEKQKEAQQTQEITMLKAQISQMNEKFDKLVGMLSGGNPANTKKEE